MTTRSTILSTALLMGLACPGVAAAKAKPACPPTTVFTTDLKYLEGYRVFLGPDGDSKVEPLRIDAREVPLLKTGKMLGIIDLPKEADRGAEIVVGAADVDLPAHPAPYKEMFILLGGSFTFTTATFSAPMKPGSVLLFDDVGAKIGHGGHIGPCGYISLSIKPAS